MISCIKQTLKLKNLRYVCMYISNNATQIFELLYSIVSSKCRTIFTWLFISLILNKNHISLIPGLSLERHFKGKMFSFQLNLNIYSSHCKKHYLFLAAVTRATKQRFHICYFYNNLDIRNIYF